MVYKKVGPQKGSKKGRRKNGDPIFVIYNYKILPELNSL